MTSRTDDGSGGRKEDDIEVARIAYVKPRLAKLGLLRQMTGSNDQGIPCDVDGNPPGCTF